MGPPFGVSDHPSLSGLAAQGGRGVKAEASAPYGAALTRSLGRPQSARDGWLRKPWAKLGT